MPKRTLNWKKCITGTWCSLEHLKVNHEHFDDLEGVYIIWYLDEEGKVVVVKVGQGGIEDPSSKNNGIRGRLRSHKTDPEVQAYAGKNLQVTWAQVTNDDDRDGIERYLGNELDPLIADRFPDVTPIPVNLPDLATP